MGSSKRSKKWAANKVAKKLGKYDRLDTTIQAIKELVAQSSHAVAAKG